ncbi:hypothetical protein GCM10011506_15700 [Marivirga lumbricoides]|uniref:PAC domain-containing protein n=1 Tax=Marivirga lumbricoides TaxID=1046115 RepID=A0ABQ1LZ98_9BACT|nr:hypothetical protein GCM10011506_15700 [Marivirga lumbricoides]
MNILPFKFVRKTHLASLEEILNKKERTISHASGLIKEIEKGNLDFEVNEAGDDELGNAIISMRDQMKSFAIAEKERNWATEGLSKFVDILRSNNDDIKSLCEDIIKNLIKYLDANQGALFILNNDNPSEVFLELTACYAYNRKKHAQRKISIGEGLVGQTVLEKDTIYLTEIPTNYINITSGLGDAPPRTILLVPLKMNDEIYGVVELASFHDIFPYQIAFVERLGESIASTISSVKVNQKTKVLLQESQSQTEELRAQEEEVRQNMEELSATQEEMSRVLKEVQGNEAFMNNLINATDDSIISIDKNYNIIVCNKTTTETYSASGLQVGKGFNILRLFEEEQKEIYKGYYDRALSGEKFEVSESYKYNGKEQFFIVNYSPLRNENGEINGCVVFGKDITESTEAKMETERLLKESQQQSEELRAQEEELKQNMEELSATQEEMERVMKEVQDNERFMSDLIDATSDNIFTVDKNYNLLIFNKAFQDVWHGQGLDVKRGMPISKIFDESEIKGHMQLIDKSLKGELIQIDVEKLIGGEINHFNVIYSPIKNDENEIVAVAIFAKNTTEVEVAKKKQLELFKESQNQAEELRAQEEELKQNMEELSATEEEVRRVLNEVENKSHYNNELLNASNDSIVTIDKNYRIISFNKAFNVAFEEQNIDISEGFDILSIFPEEIHEEKKSLYNKVFKGETIYIDDQLENIGIKNYYNVQHSPIKDQEGNIIAISIFARDITEIKSLQLELEELKKKKK